MFLSKSSVQSLFKFCLFLFGIMALSSCSEDDSTDEIPPAPTVNGIVKEYLGEPNADNQLLTEVFVEDNNVSLYFFGSTDEVGMPGAYQSITFQHQDPDSISFLILDEEQRIKTIYFEVAGQRTPELFTFDYPNDDFVNVAIDHRDWNTMEDSLLFFTTVDVSKDEFTAQLLFGKLNEIVLNSIVKAAGVLVATAVVVVAAYTAPVALAVGLVAASALINPANAEEPLPVDSVPESIATPEPVEGPTCNNPNFEVFLNEDPNNLLVAFVNGNTATYNFYWSTGEYSLSEAIGHNITAPGPGTYAVLAIDENGCRAFESITIQGDEENDPQLLIGVWLEVAYLENGVNILSPGGCDYTLEFTSNQMIYTDYFGDSCENQSIAQSSYTLNGNTITESANGQSATSTILELTNNSLKLGFSDDGNNYVEVYSR